MKRGKRKRMKIARALADFLAAIAGLGALSIIIAEHERTHGEGSFDADRE